ncbi:hypothetical protein [Chryseobacterium sp. 2987]|uniref:hypothetical protein n=1 Tax=Chryseobacterium sp. 2987 TaxID=2817767 RepID=UPI00285ADD8F|nr:hypothetical protein [Chryseobacterium sp. 2987]MDR6923079.1 hypothetical protein [Chryseobacterium sp. 2987]
MQTSKFSQLILCLFFITISCKKNDSDKSIIRAKQENQVSSVINNINDNSFVLSCGSGCAMTYTPETVSQDKQTVNVKFKVETYINEKPSDTYYEKYNFVYNSLGEIEKVNLEGKNDDILQNLMPDVQAEFKKFSKILLKNKNVDISKFSKTKQTYITNNSKFCTLPFDFDTYYKACIEDNKNCEGKYPSYTFLENKDILENYGIKEQPSIFFLLPKINNLQPIILAFTDSDIEGYFLKIVNNNKIISSLQIGKMDGETIEDFVITETFDINIYTRNNSTEKRVLKKKYKIMEL